MKYIRTKDGIYKRREDTYIEDNILYQVGYDFGRICLGEVIKESNTIEELCDRFVFKDKKYQEEKNRFTVYTRLFEKKNLPKYIQNGIEIYAAIWCEWGLKYVAKMDDKGDLELI